MLGLETHLVGPRDVREKCPLIDVTDVLGALYDPNEGHLDPSGATHAYAKAARINGAEIYRHTCVTALERTASGEWNVVTDRGTILADTS